LSVERVSPTSLAVPEPTFRTANSTVRLPPGVSDWSPATDSRSRGRGSTTIVAVSVSVLVRNRGTDWLGWTNAV
jgi:hypothetical protein